MSADGAPGAAYRSHLEALGAFFHRAVMQLEARTVSQQRDMQVIKVLLLFDRYAKAVEQRRDGPWRDLLLAADEVLHAAMRCVARAPGWKVRPVVAPIPVVRATWSPNVTPRDLFPAELRVEGADGVPEAAMRLLPVGLLELSPVVREAPWQLVLLAHELGHVLLHEALQPAIDTWTNRVQGAIPGWARFAEEVFADVVAARLVGGHAVWALSELADPEGLATNRHPSMSDRVALAKMVASAIGVASFQDWHGDATSVAVAGIGEVWAQELDGLRLDVIEGPDDVCRLRPNWLQAAGNGIFAPTQVGDDRGALAAAVALTRAAAQAMQTGQVGRLPDVAKAGLEAIAAYRPPDAAKLRLRSDVAGQSVAAAKDETVARFLDAVGGDGAG